MKSAIQSAFAMLAMAAASALPAAAGSAHGYLGVSVRDVTQDQLPALKLKDARGAEIILVDHDAPAGKAGLREHDVVLTINGQAVDNREQFSHMMRESAPGRTLVLVVSHDGQTRTVTTQMATQEEVERQAEQRLTVAEPMPMDAPQENSAASAPAPSAPPMRGNSFIGSILMSSSYTGAVLEKMSGQLGDYFGVPGGSGLLVRSVQENSPASLAGIHAGDVIVRAGDKPVATTSDWTKALKSSRNRPLAVTVVRDKKQQTLSLNPESRKRSSVEFPDAPAADDESSAPAVAALGMSLMPRS